MELMLKKLHLNIGMIIVLLALVGCNSGLGGVPSRQGDALTASPTATTIRAVTQATPEPSATSTPKPSNTPLPTITPQPTPTATLEPFAGYRIDDLASRNYGGGELVVEETLAQNSYFTRYLVSYPSDELKIYGFMNVPNKGSSPYPVVIAIHGYIEPEIYNTIDYTTRYADALARAGYLVIHPNLRGYPPSDSGDNLFRVGMAIDVLNLIAMVKTQAGQPGALEYANGEAIGIWGHSMGGGISTRVITVNPDIKAAVLYGAMSGDERKNFERIFTYFSDGERGLEELMVPDEVIQQVSPINYLERIRAAVSIHHGQNDVDVPLEWSLDLCRRLLDLGKSVECFTYKGEPHTFHGAGDDLFTLRMVTFYDKFLKNR